MNLEAAAKLTHEQWREMAADLKKTAETRLFIGGEFVDAIDGGTFDNINPVDGTFINKCAAGQAADIDKAVKIAKASFKSGALQVVNGLGEEAGQALARHMDVSKISFTGSTEVGKLIHIYSGESNMKKVSLECGGKGPQVMCEDLEGELLDRAVEAAVNGIFFNAGQVCSAGSRLIVHSKIYDEFVEKFIEKGKEAYVCGDPLDPAVNLGPLVEHDAQSRVLGMIERAASEGGKIEFGGGAPANGLESGAYIVPTMITGVNDNDFVAQNEVFAPVVAVVKVDSDDEAIAVANNSVYGLQGSVWTDNYRRAMRYAREIECGTFLVNSFEEGDMTQPFGGFKQSGNAKDKCFESLLSYMNTKAAWFRLN